VFSNRRDEAIIRLLFETGARAGEVVAIGRGPTAGWWMRR
jgi:integrase